MKNKNTSLQMAVRLILFVGLVVCAVSTAGTVQATVVYVGLVVDSSGVNDNGWNELAYQGLLKAHDDLGVAIAVYTGDDYEARLNACVAAGNDLCIATSWSFYDALLTVAPANPSVMFAILDTNVGDTPPANLLGIGFVSKEAGYLAGTLAGLMSASDKIGAVGGIDIPPVVEFMEGYKNGAQCANENVDVLQQYTGTFIDPDLGASVAADMISQEADVIFGVGGLTGNGAILYSASHDVWSIGVDNDQYETVFGGGSIDGADKLLTSAIKRLDNAVYKIIQDYIDHGSSAFGKNIFLGLATGGVGLADFHETDAFIPQSVKDQLADVEDGIINETIFVDDPCAITIWHSNSPGSPGETPFQENVADIQAADPTLPRIITTFQPDVMLFNQAVQNGWGPDLFIASNDLITTSVQSGVLLDLDSYVAGELSNFESYALDGLTVNGSLYGLPDSSVVVGLYYNKSTISSPPSTTAELYDALSIDGKTLTAMGLDLGAYFFYGFWNAFDGKLLSPDNLCVADQGGVEQAMHNLLDLQDTGNALFLTDYETANNEFRAGTKDMLTNGPWILGDFESSLGADLGVAPLPEGPAGKPAIPMTGMTGIYVNGMLQSPPEVIQILVDLALALTSQSSAQRMTDEGLSIPVRTDVVSTDPLVSVFKQIAEAGDSTPRGLELNNYWDPFNVGINKILNKELTPREGIKTACDTMNDLNGFPSVSGNVGVEGGESLITYDGGWTDWNVAGDYIFYVVPGWSGTITPSIRDFLFTPENIALNDVQADFTNQNFTRKLTASKFAFVWRDIPDATAYKLQLSTKPNFSTLIFSIKTTASEYAYLTSLQNDKLYYWRIAPKIGGVWKAWYPTWRFESMDPLLAPELILPANSFVFTGTRTPEFTWEVVENAAYYKIQISKSILFNTFVQKAKIMAGTDPLSFTPNSLANGKYFWRVKAFDSAGGSGPWSPIRMFKIKIPVP